MPAVGRRPRFRVVTAAGVRLLGARDVREIAGRLGVRPTKRLGQNFVVEPGTVRQIAALAAPRAGDVILEVGPGLGSLTLALLEAAAATADARIVAVEIDPVLAAELPRTIASRAPALADRVRVVHADAFTVSATAVGDPTLLAANLPYNVAVPVVLRMLADFPSLARGVVMVQAEVADRMCAAPGSRVYGAPSAKLAWFAAARLAGTVPRTVFWPVPNVDSKLVTFSVYPGGLFFPGGLRPPSAPRSGGLRFPGGLRPPSAPRSGGLPVPPNPPGAGSAETAEPAGTAETAGTAEPAGTAETAGVSREAVFAVIDAAFGQRRKTLRAALAGWAGSPARAEHILRAAGIDPAARGESLSITEFARLAQAGRVPG